MTSHVGYTSAYGANNALVTFEALRIVAGAHHNESLHGTDIWLDIENWIDTHIVR